MPSAHRPRRTGSASGRALHNAVRLCSVQGCTHHRDGFSHYCATHRKRAQRQGHPLQRQITVTELDHYERWVLLNWARMKETTGTDPLDVLASNWRIVVSHARDQLECEKAGLAPPCNHDSRNHLVDLVCLQAVEVWRWVPRIIALHMHLDRCPNDFQSDQAFFVQVGRLVWMKRQGVREVAAGLSGWVTARAEQRGELPSLRRRELMGRTLSDFAGKATAHSLVRYRREREEQAEAKAKTDALFSITTI